MTTLHDLNIGLAQSQHAYFHGIYIEMLSYKVLEFFHQSIKLIREIASIDPSEGSMSAYVSRGICVL